MNVLYKLRYSDYPGTDTGPPDPERWAGPPGPPGTPGKDGEGALVGPVAPGNVPSPLWWDSNSGQLFVQYNDGTSTQWVSANSIDASTLEGSFLPLSGGTMQGPLNYTATGGSVIRSAQDRAADVVNALDFGADPTYTRDSTGAFRQALLNSAAGGGRRKAVYFPTGVYRINGQLDLSACQAFYGDSRGSSVLMIDDQFDPTATAVLFVTASNYDAGPVLRDFGITFVQPQDQGSRANFKTLAQGGTSHPGGTGVKYPWAIVAGSDSFRIQCICLRIGGAWDGITSNGHNAVFRLEAVEMGALDCGTSLGEGTSGGIQDFCHVSGYHFWNFDLGGNLWNVFNDGLTVGLRVGRTDGLDVRDLALFCGRLIFTGENGGFTHCDIVNCQMDGDQSYIEINTGGVAHLNISNIYGSAGTGRVRPYISVNGACHLHITNYRSVSSSNFPDILVNDYGAEVTLANFDATFYPNNIRWAEVQRGILRIVDGYLLLAGPRTVSVIAETFDGHLIVDDITVQGATPSGPLISAVASSQWTMIGRLQVETGNTWTYALPAGLTQRFFSPRTEFNGSATVNGLKLANVYASGPTDHSKHLDIYNNTAGINLTSNANLNFNSPGAYVFFLNGVQIGFILSNGLNIPIGLTTPYDAAFAVLGVNGAAYLHGVANGPSYANDAAAEAGGVGPHQAYRNGSAVMVRVV